MPQRAIANAGVEHEVPDVAEQKDLFIGGFGDRQPELIQVSARASIGLGNAAIVKVHDFVRYANPESYLIPPASWPASRPEVCTLTQTPQDGATRVKERQTELEALLRRFDDELPRHPSLRIEDESLVVGPLHAEDKPHSLVTLEASINARLPLVELPDLLMEVDGWTGFSRHLEHAGGAEPRAPEWQWNSNWNTVYMSLS